MKRSGFKRPGKVPAKRGFREVLKKTADKISRKHYEKMPPPISKPFTADRSKIAEGNNKLLNREQRKAAMSQVANDINRSIAGACPYVFPEHLGHASQPCTRHAGHLGPHHCGGIRK